MRRSFRQSVRRSFLSRPIAVALSLEIPDPGDFLTQTIMGKPLLLTRDKEGVLHCFINVCRHRGAKVCAAERGPPISIQLSLSCVDV